MRIAGVIMLSVLLSGCAEYQERQEEARMMGHHMRCRSYGLEVGSPTYANCMQNQDNQDDANQRAVIGALLSQPQPQPYFLPMPAPIQPITPRSCQSTINGQIVNTTCY